MPVFTLPLIDGALNLVGKVFDKIPDPALRDQLKAEGIAAATQAATVAKTAEQAINLAQIDLLKAQIAVNATESSSPSRLIAGWRPVMAWASGGVLVLAPIVSWIMTCVAKFPPFPTDYYNVIASVFASLAGIRMVEKIKGVAAGSPTNVLIAAHRR